jgi:RNA polymerase sigma factor (TIGR02999 family)
MPFSPRPSAATGTSAEPSAPANEPGGTPHVTSLDAVFPIAYDELRRLAAGYLSRERPDHTLQPTALVHEAYIRLTEQRGVVWRNRSHFLGIAATMMRRILVNHAEAHRAAKRGGGETRVTLDTSVDGAAGSDDGAAVEVLALDAALTALSRLDARAARVVELRFFAGLGIEETAEVLGTSPATVKREWLVARTWLRREVVRDA